MKRLKLPPLFALIISMQMIFSPFAGAQSALEIMNMAGSAVGMLMGGQQGPSPQTQAQLAILRQQARPVPDKYFNQATLSKIPGFVNYLTKNGIPFPVMECPQLPAKPAKVKASVCTEGISGDANNPMVFQNQMFEANAYKEAYTFLEEEYDSFLTTATSATKKQGVGCMEEARQHLSGFFQYRMNELDSLVNKLEAINKQFEDASKADLNAIEEITALLEGGNSELYNEVKSRSNNSELFDFSKRFQDPACSAVFTAERFNDTGLDRGFNGISKLLKQTYEQPAQGAQYSAQSFPQASTVVKQKIKKLAIDLEAQSRLGWRDLVAGKRDLSSFTKATGTEFNPSPAIFADMQTTFSTKLDQLQSRTVNVLREFSAAGINPQDAVNQIAERNPETFKSQMANLRNRVTNKCLNDQMASVDTILSRLEDSKGTSNFAQKNSPNVLKDRIRAILANDSISAEQKIIQVQNSEREFSRYVLRMDQKIDEFSSASNQPVAKRVNSISEYLTVLKNNCTHNAENVRLENKSANQALSELNNINQEYQGLARTLGTDLRRNIESKMLDCSDNTIGNTSGSCSPGVFNERSNNFCARVADVCAGKMRACTEQTKQFVAAQKVQRDARKKSYNTQMTANKQKVIALFDATMAQYKLEADAMNSQFGIGFTPPTGILREVPENSRYLGKLAQATNGSEDGTLLLEDPKQFVKMFTANVEKLKASVKAQQDGIMGNGGNGGIIANHIKQARDNMTNAKREMASMARDCDRKVAEARRQFEENQRRMAEENQKRQEEQNEALGDFCRRWDTARVNPAAGCSGVEGELFSSLGQLVDSNSRRELQVYCYSNNNEANESGNTNQETQLIRQALRICLSPEAATFDDTKKANCEIVKCEPRVEGTGENRVETRCNADMKFIAAESIVGRGASSGADNAETYASNGLGEVPPACNSIIGGEGKFPGMFGSGNPFGNLAAGGSQF